MNHSKLPDPQLSIGQLDFDFIRALVRRKSSIALDGSKAYLVISRLGPIAREHGFDSVGALISHLQ